MSDIPATRNYAHYYATGLRARAFLVWMWEVDSSIPKLRQALIAQEAADAALEGREPRPMPDVNTLNRWRKDDDWEAQRHLALTQDNRAEALYNHAIGKHLLLLDKASTRHAEILDLPLSEPVLDREGNHVGDRPSPALATIYKAIEGVYTVAKLIGRADGDPTPKLKPPRVRVITEGRTPEQIAKERMERGRAAKPRRTG